MWENGLTTTLLLVGLTVGCYFLSRSVYRKYPVPLLHPIPVATMLIIIFLRYTEIEFKTYAQSASVVSFFLGPATVALGYNLYRYLPVIRRRALPILLGSLTGAVSGVLSVLLIGRVLGCSNELILSLIPKSTTTPIAVAVAAKIGGIGSLTVSVVIATGILGAMVGPEFLSIARINGETPKGLAIGAAAHAVGTSRALQEGMEQGTMAGVAIILVGLFTALIAGLVKLI